MTTTPEPPQGREQLADTGTQDSNTLPNADRGARGRLYVVAAALILAGWTAYFLLLGSVQSGDGISELDRPIMEWMLANRSPEATAVNVFITTVTGPIAMPIIVLAACIFWIRRSRGVQRPLLLASGMLLGVTLVFITTRLVDRPRPPAELMLLERDPTSSFPSGHVVGTADLTFLLVYLVVSRWQKWLYTIIGIIASIIGVITVALTRIYLGYHWLTDVTASLSLALVVLGVVIAADTSLPATRGYRSRRGVPAFRRRVSKMT